MSTSQPPLKEYQQSTLPSSFVDTPLTPPPTDEKVSTQALRDIALFGDIQAGRHTKQHSVIVEVAYSQKKKRLDRLAEDYLLNSDASVQIVRTHIAHTGDGDELRVVREISDEAFRDDQGNSTDHPGLRLHLSEFACEELTQNVISARNGEVFLSTQQLCRYLAAAEDKTQGKRTLVKHSIFPEVKKRKRSETPLERMASDDEAEYVKQEERAAKRIADNDLDYEDT
ncbi:MAG: hypothetical protein M1813_008222 [Trichoglossum hirsutum]|nr:MAG: hypothetical protein M1813_008222 [Trichoglossum hirsutum]